MNGMPGRPLHRGAARLAVVALAAAALLAASRAADTEPAASTEPAADMARAPSPPASATTIPLSLAEALARARAASPRMESLRHLQEGAGAGLRGARAERLPQIDLTAAYSRLSGVPELVAPLPPPQGPTTIFPNLRDRSTSRLGVTLPLDTAGRLGGQVAAADREREATDRDLDAGDADLVLETTAAYWDLLTARETESVLRAAVATYAAHLKDAENRQAFGMAARNEVLQVQVNRDRAELARVQAAAAFEAAQAGLARLLALPPGTRVEPTDPLAPLPAAAEDLEDLVRRAATSRPDRAALAARAEAAEARVRIARADRFPQAKVTAGLDYADPNARILPLEEGWRSTWDATVGLSLRVFDSGRTSAAVERQSALAAAARSALADFDLRLREEVTRRLLDLTTAAASVDLAARNLAAAEENRRVAADRYRAGVIPSTELLDAETSLLNAGLDRTDSLAAERVARARLDRAIGARP